MSPRPDASRSGRTGWDTYRAFFAAAVECGLAVALWRLPATDDLYAVASLTTVSELPRIDFRHRRPGFVFAPFANERNVALRIDADLTCAPDGVTLPDSGDRHLHGVRQRFCTALHCYDDGSQPAPRWHTGPAPLQADHAASTAEFTGLVQDAITFIQDTGIAKVVVSRTAERALPVGFDPTAAFLELCVRYPQAFVSLVAIPGVGTWIGASPEVLLTLDDSALTTMALAGTQRRPEDRPLEEVRWGSKETVEQEMVSTYVREFFRGADVAHVEETGPRTVAAGNVVHLQTLFRVALPEDDRLHLANRVLAELHPTSAVCGMPKQKALSFILENERYDRSFYSGFLGPVHVDGRSSLFVNLRCMQVHAASASLYVGAGVTADSDPAAEWRETEMKAETVLGVLQPMERPISDD